jgi:hypothetical protein
MVCIKVNTRLYITLGASCMMEESSGVKFNLDTATIMHLASKYVRSLAKFLFTF